MKSIPSYLVHRLKYILLQSDMSFVELFMSLSYFGWFYILISNPHLFDNVSTFDRYSRGIPQVYWAYLMLLIGSLKLIGVLGSIRWFRFIGAVLGTTLWSYTCVTFWGTTSSVIYFTFAFGCFFTAIRHAQLSRDKMTERAV